MSAIGANTIRRGVLTLLLASTALPAAEAPPRRDPFAAPALPPPAPAASPRYAGAPPAPPGPPPAPPPVPELRAVLAAGSASLANIDGKLLALGEEVDGYRLIEVGDDSAVLARGRRRLRLQVYEDDKGNNE